MENLQAQQRPTNRPSRCTSLYMKREQFKEVFEDTAWHVDSFVAELNMLKNTLAGVCDKRFVLFKNKALWFDRDVAGLYPRWDKVDLPKLTYMMDAETASEFRTWKQDGLEFSCMTRDEAAKTFHKGSGNPYIENTCLKYIDRERYTSVAVVVELPQGEGYATWYGIDDDFFRTDDARFWFDNIAMYIPIHRLHGKNASPMGYAEAFRTWLIMGLLPEGLNRR